MTKNKTKWKQEKESTKKYILQLSGYWIGIVEAEREKQAEEVMLRTVNKLREEQDCIFKIYKNTFENSFLREEWFTKGLRIRKGYKGYYCVAVVDGVKQLEGWLDYTDGFKSAYNKIRRYINENFSEDSELILYIDLKHRDCKRPTENDEGYLRISIEDTMKKGSGIDILGLLKGVKDLGVGDFSRLYGAREVIDYLGILVDTDICIDGLSEAIDTITGNYYGRLYKTEETEGGISIVEADSEYIEDLWTIKEDEEKIEIKKVIRKDIIDLLSLTEEEKKREGLFRLQFKDTIKLEEVLGREEKAFIMTNNMIENLIDKFNNRINELIESYKKEEIEYEKYTEIEINTIYEDYDVYESIRKDKEEGLDIPELRNIVYVSIEEATRVVKEVDNLHDGINYFLEAESEGDSYRILNMTGFYFSEDEEEVEDDLIFYYIIREDDKEKIIEKICGNVQYTYWYPEYDKEGYLVDMHPVTNENIMDIVCLTEEERKYKLLFYIE